MAYGALIVGRLVLAEPWSVSEKPGTMSLTGQESSPPSTRAAVYAAHADLNALAGVDGVIPVSFPDKPERDGFYSVAASSSNLEDWPGAGVTCDWRLELTRFGGAGFVDLESQLVPAARANDAAQTGTLWHAVPVGALAYDTGATAALTATRVTEDGSLTMYYSVPADVAPRWYNTPAGYRLGRARVLDATREVTGEREVDPTAWEVQNGLVRIRPSGANLEIATWASGAWKPKLWTLTSGTDVIGPFFSATILRNDFEQVGIRLTDVITLGGRATLDLVLSRGSRIVDVYAYNGVAVTWKLDLVSSEAGTAGTGYRSATANDADGLRFIVGSTKNFTAAPNGGVSITASMQAWAGWVGTVPGASPPNGDLATDLRAQYIGAPAEQVRAVRR